METGNELDLLYESVPIKKNMSETRVLDILPGRKDEVIQVRIRVIDIGLDPNYEALSYTWGKSTEGRFILIQGRYKADVTDNLYNALFHMRRRYRRRALWVDQLCINQTDAQERSQQVGMMGSIYKSARCVNVWLGKADRPHPTNLASNLATWLKFSVTQLYWLVKQNLLDESHPMRRYRKAMLKALVSSEHFLEYWDACRNLPAITQQAIDATEPCWLDRVWVVQEFALGREIYFWCGFTSFPYSSRRWGTLKAIHGLDMPRRFNDRICLQMDTRFRKPQQVLEEELKSGVPSYRQHHVCVSTLIKFAGEFNTTYATDRVLGFLGILNEEEAAYIGSDCDMSAAEVFARATYASIKYHNDYDVFIHISREPVTPRLPSWSFDFARQRACQPLYSERVWPPTPLMGVQASFAPNTRGGAQLTTLNENNTLLAISAASLGTIVASLPVWSEGRSPQLSSRELWEFVRNTDCLVDQRECSECWDGFRIALNLHHSRPACHKTSVQDQYDFEESLSELLLDAQSGKTSWDSGHRQLHARVKVHSVVFNLFAYLCGTPYPTDRAKLLRDPSFSNSDVYTDISANLFITSTGLIGIAPGTVSKGDSLILLASTDPFVALRPTANGYEFRAHVWVWGIPVDEVTKNWHNLEFAWKKYVLY